MAKQCVELDIEEAYEEDFIDGFEDLEIVNEPSCDHSLVFLHAGQGQYDIYRCKKCKETITKSWNDIGTTTYKDRV